MPAKEMEGEVRNRTPAAPAPRVGIFRLNLFRPSEPFITAQAERLERHEPLYLGRLRFGRPPDGAVSRALGDRGSIRSLPTVVAQMITRDPRPYARALGDRRLALLHAHFGVDGVYALPLARRLGVPLVTTFHGFDATMSDAGFLRSPAWVNYPLFRGQLARRGDLFLCVSSFIRERVLALGFPSERTVIHRIGVDCDAIRPEPARDDASTILHVARLVDMKGTRYLLHAFASLDPAKRRLTLVIIGDGPRRKRLEALARSAGIADRVRFLGARPHAEVLARMRDASLLVLPSVEAADGRTEGLGMVLLEAAATGRPVVASRSGGIPEAVIDGRTGFLVPTRDPAALAARINALLRDVALRHRFGADARAHAERHFDLGQQTALLETLYDRVLARTLPAPRDR